MGYIENRFSQFQEAQIASAKKRLVVSAISMIWPTSKLVLGSLVDIVFKVTPTMIEMGRNYLDNNKEDSAYKASAKIATSTIEEVQRDLKHGVEPASWGIVEQIYGNTDIEEKDKINAINLFSRIPEGNLFEVDRKRVDTAMAKGDKRALNSIVIPVLDSYRSRLSSSSKIDTGGAVRYFELLLRDDLNRTVKSARNSKEPPIQPTELMRIVLHGLEERNPNPFEQIRRLASQYDVLGNNPYEIARDLKNKTKGTRDEEVVNRIGNGVIRAAFYMGNQINSEKNYAEYVHGKRDAVNIFQPESTVQMKSASSTVETFTQNQKRKGNITKDIDKNLNFQQRQKIFNPDIVSNKNELEHLIAFGGFDRDSQIAILGAVELEAKVQSNTALSENAREQLDLLATEGTPTETLNVQNLDAIKAKDSIRQRFGALSHSSVDRVVAELNKAKIPPNEQRRILEDIFVPKNPDINISRANLDKLHTILDNNNIKSSIQKGGGRFVNLLRSLGNRDLRKQDSKVLHPYIKAYGIKQQSIASLEGMFIAQHNNLCAEYARQNTTLLERQLDIRNYDENIKNRIGVMKHINKILSKFGHPIKELTSPAKVVEYLSDQINKALPVESNDALIDQTLANFAKANPDWTVAIQHLRPLIENASKQTLSQEVNHLTNFAVNNDTARVKLYEAMIAKAEAEGDMERAKSLRDLPIQNGFPIVENIQGIEARKEEVRKQFGIKNKTVGYTTYWPVYNALKAEGLNEHDIKVVMSDIFPGHRNKAMMEAIKNPQGLIKRALTWMGREYSETITEGVLNQEQKALFPYIYAIKAKNELADAIYTKAEEYIFSKSQQYADRYAMGEFNSEHTFDSLKADSEILEALTGRGLKLVSTESVVNGEIISKLISHNAIKLDEAYMQTLIRSTGQNYPELKRSMNFLEPVIRNRTEKRLREIRQEIRVDFQNFLGDSKLTPRSTSKEIKTALEEYAKHRESLESFDDSQKSKGYLKQASRLGIDFFRRAVQERDKDIEQISNDFLAYCAAENIGVQTLAGDFDKQVKVFIQINNKKPYKPYQQRYIFEHINSTAKQQQMLSKAHNKLIVEASDLERIALQVDPELNIKNIDRLLSPNYIWGEKLRGQFREMVAKMRAKGESIEVNQLIRNKLKARQDKRFIKFFSQMIKDYKLEESDPQLSSHEFMAKMIGQYGTSNGLIRKSEALWLIETATDFDVIKMQIESFTQAPLPA